MRGLQKLMCCVCVCVCVCVSNRASVSRIGGMSLSDLQRESESFWTKAFPEKALTKLEDYGFIQVCVCVCACGACVRACVCVCVCVCVMTGVI